MLRALARFGLLALGLALGGCGADEEKAFHIYTSLYPQVIKHVEPKLRKQFPGVEFRFYQMGSEQIAGRLGIELETGESPCDLLLTSDPFFYAQLAEDGHLLAYESPAAGEVPAAFRDPEHRYTTVRVPLMVLAVNHERLRPEEFPSSFADLADPRYRGKVAMGDPLKSGTTFTTLGAWLTRYGWGFIEKLKQNDIVAAGGNSTVLREVESGALPIGVILLENLLPSLEQGAPITVIYPTDGAIPVPSPVAILKQSDKPALAKQVYDFLFSAGVQAEIVRGAMYSPLPKHAPPEGAKPWDELALFSWNAENLAWVKGERAAIKKRFRALMRK